MNKGLFLNDFITFKHIILRKPLFISLSFLLILNFLFGKNGSQLLNLIVLFIVIFTSLNVFNSASRSWDNFISSTNIPSIKIANSRFIFLLFAIFSSNIFILLINYIEYFIFKGNSLKEVLFMSLISFLLSLILIIIIIPLIYMVGFSNFQTWFLIILGLIITFSKFIHINFSLSKNIINNSFYFYLFIIIGILIVISLYSSSLIINYKSRP